MEDTPYSLTPLYQVWDKDEARQNRKESKSQRDNEIECCIGKGAPSGFPQFASWRGLFPLPLLKPQICVDDAGRALQPSEHPEPPTCRIIMTDANPIRGWCSKRKDPGSNNLHIDLSALFTASDKPQVPGKHRRPGHSD